MSKQSMRIGPDMPDLPSMKAAPSPEPGQTVTKVERATPDVVRTETPDGLVVETIMSVQKPRVETPAEMKARVKESYVDSHGNLVETY